MQDRATYDDIKTWILSNYWSTCRDTSHLTRQPPEKIWTEDQVVYSAYDGFASGSGSFDSVLEYLMLEVICMVLAAWLPHYVDMHRRNIRKYLADNSLAEMVKDIPDEEARDFLSDLRLLGFLEKGTPLSPTLTVP